MPGKDDREDDVTRDDQPSNLFYWWIVWAYGFVCTLLTRFAGNGVELDDRWFYVNYVHPSPWLGISFVMVLVGAPLLTNCRFRGATSLHCDPDPPADSLTMYIMHVWIFMNLGFYFSLSSVLLALWLIDVFTSIASTTGSSRPAR